MQRPTERVRRPRSLGCRRASLQTERHQMTHFGIVSTYPPTQCGLATFSASLLKHLRSPLDRVEVVSSVDAYQPDAPAEVVYQWTKGSPAQTAEAARVLDGMDVVVLQHEFGIFGGPDGRDVLDLVRLLSVPVVVVLHTVLAEPSAVAAGHHRGAGRPRRRRRDDDRDGPGAARRALRRRPQPAPGDPARRTGQPAARRPARRRRRLPPGRSRARPHRPHLGPDRARQGHRVGDRGHGRAARPRPAGELPRRRGDASQGRGAHGRGSTAEGLTDRARDLGRRRPRARSSTATWPPTSCTSWCVAPTSCCCPTTRATRSPPASSSRR